MNLKRWELTHTPTTDRDRWRLKLKIDERDLPELVAQLPVPLGQPFLMEDDDFTVAFYLYDCAEAVITSLRSALSAVAAPVQPAAATPPVTFLDLELISRYTFQDFIVGPNNRFTAAAAQAVADNPGRIYNPFFIYGGVGLGKTHLMHAVGHYVREKNPKIRVANVTTEKFISDVIDAIKNGVVQQMRDHYRQADLLLMDDIQFLANSESTQEEFFHTFNVLHQSGKQIIITCDRPPKLLTTLEDRLRNRFEWGLIADIKSPNLETRVAILKKKGEAANLNLDENMLLYIASKLKSNIRELEGFLKRINAYASLTHQEVNMDLVKSIMADLLPAEEPEEQPTQKPSYSTTPLVQPPVTFAAPQPKAVIPPPAAVPAVAGKPGVPPDAAESSLKPVDVAFFFPTGKESELATVKERFREVIKKHRLKFRLVGVFETAYQADGAIDYFEFPRLCKEKKVTIAVVLGPCTNLGSESEEFANTLMATMDEAGISLQLIPWQELTKDYRYLNLALDITLTKSKS